MSTRLVEVKGSQVTIEMTVELSRSMLDTEEAIQVTLNEAGCLASQEALRYFDTDGSPIQIGPEIWRTKGQQPKLYQTPYGEVELERHVYQRSGGAAATVAVGSSGGATKGMTQPKKALRASSSPSKSSVRGA